MTCHEKYDFITLAFAFLVVEKGRCIWGLVAVGGWRLLFGFCEVGGFFRSWNLGSGDWRVRC